MADYGIIVSSSWHRCVRNQVLVFFGSSAWRKGQVFHCFFSVFFLVNFGLIGDLLYWFRTFRPKVLHTIDQRGNWHCYFCFDCGPWGGYGRTCHNILLEHPRDVLNIKRWDKVHLEVFSGRTFARVLERGVVSIMKFVGCSVRLKKMFSKWRKEKCIWIVVLAMHVALEAHILQMWGRDAKRNVSLKVTTVYNSQYIYIVDIILVTCCHMLCQRRIPMLLQGSFFGSVPHHLGHRHLSSQWCLEPGMQRNTTIQTSVPSNPAVL